LFLTLLLISTTFTIGLPAVEIPEIKGKVNQKDELKIDITKFTLKNISRPQSHRRPNITTKYRNAGSLYKSVTHLGNINENKG
jgi:hypothetical protein